MRISIPQSSGRNGGTWQARFMFDPHESAHMFGKNRSGLADVRVSIRGNTIDGISIGVDTHGKYKVQFGTGNASPAVTVSCNDFGFLLQGKPEIGVTTSFNPDRPGHLKVPIIPEQLQSMDVRRQLKVQREMAAKTSAFGGLAKLLYPPNNLLDPPSPAQSGRVLRSTTDPQTWEGAMMDTDPDVPKPATPRIRPHNAEEALVRFLTPEHFAESRKKINEMIASLRNEIAIANRYTTGAKMTLIAQEVRITQTQEFDI